MTLFWREQRPLILFYVMQMILVALLYWAAGENGSLEIMFYGALLSSVVLLLFLLYRFAGHRRLYMRLAQSGQGRGSGEHEPHEPLGEAPLPEAVNNMLLDLDRRHRDEIQVYKNRMDQHIGFINRWVHQMKTPLSVIQLVNQDLDNEAAAGSIQEELERLRRGLEMVLYTSRLDRLEEDFKVERTMLRQAVSESIAENRNLFIRSGMVPDLQVDEHTAVYTDAKWLRFMLVQLLVNAVQYSDGSGKKITITAFALGRRTTLAIRDQGIGIASEDIKRVFNPYFTGEQGRKYHESTGMGLYLVKETCERLGHEINLTSEQGKGTTVQLIFQTAP